MYYTKIFHEIPANCIFLTLQTARRKYFFRPVQCLFVYDNFACFDLIWEKHSAAVISWSIFSRLTFLRESICLKHVIWLWKNIAVLCIQKLWWQWNYSCILEGMWDWVSKFFIVFIKFYYCEYWKLLENHSTLLSCHFILPNFVILWKMNKIPG